MKTTITDNMSEEIERPNVHRFTTLKLCHWRENLRFIIILKMVYYQ